MFVLRGVSLKFNSKALILFSLYLRTRNHLVHLSSTAILSILTPDEVFPHKILPVVAPLHQRRIRHFT